MGDNRVLNFSEFADKYSVEGDNELGIDDMSTASDAFVDGFDQDSYDSPEIKPNRPVGGEDSITPPGPGEEGAANFSSFTDSGMEAPGEEELIDPMEPKESDMINDPVSQIAEPSAEEFSPIEGEEKEAEAQSAPPVEADEDGGNPEEDDEEEDEEDEDEEDEEEDDEEEEEDANESVKGLLESFDSFTSGEESNIKSRSREERDYPINIENIKMHDHEDDDHEDDDHEDDDHEDDDHECFVVCSSCGDKKTIESGEYPFGTENQMNRDSWWKGSDNGGMQCGCNA